MHSANGLNTFPIKDEPIFIHGLRNLPKILLIVPHPAHNVLRTSLYGPILVELSQTVTGPK